MKIGLLIDSMIGGGAERVSLNLAEGFLRQGHEPHLILLRDQIQHALPADLPVHALSGSEAPSRHRLLNKLQMAWRLRTLVKRLEADGEPFAFFISSAEEMDHLSALAGLHDVYIRYRNSMVEFYRNKLASRTGIKRLFRRLKWGLILRLFYDRRRLITVAKALQQEIVGQMGLQPASIATIYNPFDFESIRAQGAAYPVPLTEPYVVYAARFTPRKRQDLLLRAFARSHTRHTHKLVLLGDTYSQHERGWYEQLLALIEELGLQDRVVLPGFQTNPYPWIRHAALFAMSSDSEGLPTVLIEALILGTPVVSTDCPTGPREIMTGELARFLCPRDNPADLADRIDAALTSYPEISDALLRRFHCDYAISRYLQHCSKGPLPPAKQGRVRGIPGGTLIPPYHPR
ncbi:glycosyltransferase [Uliginosibacterium sp. 31-16]|uniref:glycosyltransferase n=1 Tax=Uliginosibacterium sp. 31-16 TaxID=3068315 RepID=UPI00273D6BBC|nr:glycosyltransferase [Uliginosibacterium sp. 31-16]MDP5238425.1 glycosyltransferase [Uliginosibacterium sp. 31-16]